MEFMSNAKSRGFLLFISMLVFLFAWNAKSHASNNALEASKYPQEVAVFVNKKVSIVTPKAYWADNDKVYVPIKQIIKMKGVTLSTNNGITVKSSNGSFKLDRSNSIVYKNATYVTFEKFLKITGYSGRFEWRGSSIFLWNDYANYEATVKKINALKPLPAMMYNFMGSKVYLYEGDRIGWVSGIKKTGYGSTEFSIQMQDGSVVVEDVFDESPNTFCEYADYQEFMSKGFINDYVWANKNVLPESNPLYNLEKIKILSVKVKNKEITFMVRRASGKTGSFKLPIQSYLNGTVFNNFYTNDPKKAYPAWKARAWELIAEQSISKGMTKDMVLMSWGSPDDTSSYSGTYISTDTWTYGDTYLYFTNGILDSWMDL